MGGAAVPEGLPEAVAAEVAVAIKLSFVDAFRVVMLVSAVLCWLSAILAAVLVEGKEHPQMQEKLRDLKLLFHDQGCPPIDHHG